MQVIPKLTLKKKGAGAELPVTSISFWSGLLFFDFLHPRDYSRNQIRNPFEAAPQFSDVNLLFVPGNSRVKSPLIGNACRSIKYKCCM
jgi:hypothetical protein